MYKTPARCLLPVGTWWAGLFSAKELRLYPGLPPMTEPQAHARVCLPLEALRRKKRRKKRRKRKGGGERRRAQPGPRLVPPHAGCPPAGGLVPRQLVGLGF